MKRMVITHPYSLSTVVHISIYIERYDTVSLLVQFFLTLVMVIEQNYITCSQLPSWPEMITILEHKCFMFLIHQSMQESSHERSPRYFATRKGAPANNQGDHPSAKRSDEEGAK